MGGGTGPGAASSFSVAGSVKAGSIRAAAICGFGDAPCCQWKASPYPHPAAYDRDESIIRGQVFGTDIHI